MKYFFALCLFLAVACNSNSADNEDSPAAVAIAFSENLHHGNLIEAKELSTEASQNNIDIAAPYLPIVPDYKVTLIDDSVAGNKAYVRLKMVGGESVSRYHLVEVDGKWKVDMIATGLDELREKKLKELRESKQ